MALVLARDVPTQPRQAHSGGTRAPATSLHESVRVHETYVRTRERDIASNVRLDAVAAEARFWRRKGGLRVRDLGKGFERRCQGVARAERRFSDALAHAAGENRANAQGRP